MHTLQGFQFFAEDLTGFGHFSYELLQLLADEYSRTPVMLWALRPTQQQATGSLVSALAYLIDCYRGRRSSMKSHPEINSSC